MSIMKPYRISKLVGLTTLMLLTLVLVACGDPTATPAPAPTTAPTTAASTSSAKIFIANLENAPATARVGVIVENGKVGVYVCSLDQEFNQTSARWYKGQLDASGSFQAVSPDGVEFKASVKDGQFSGNLLNTLKKSYNFKGEALPANGKVGLYRGSGSYNGKEVVIGATINSQGIFAATAQYKGVAEFVNPVAEQPTFLSDGVLGVKIGESKQQIEVKLVTTLVGSELA